MTYELLRTALYVLRGDKQCFPNNHVPVLVVQQRPSLEGLWMYGVTVYLDRSYGSYSMRLSGGRQLSTINSFRSRRLVNRFKCGCHGLT